MAIIVSNAAQRMAGKMLTDVLRHEIRQGNVSMATEMIGYFLSGLRVAENYNKTEVFALRGRMAAPEFLHGVIADESV